MSQARHMQSAGHGLPTNDDQADLQRMDIRQPPTPEAMPGIVLGPDSDSDPAEDNEEAFASPSAPTAWGWRTEEDGRRLHSRSWSISDEELASSQESNHEQTPAPADKELAASPGMSASGTPGQAAINEDDQYKTKKTEKKTADDPEQEVDPDARHDSFVDGSEVTEDDAKLWKGENEDTGDPAAFMNQIAEVDTAAEKLRCQKESQGKFERGEDRERELRAEIERRKNELQKMKAKRDRDLDRLRQAQTERYRKIAADQDERSALVDLLRETSKHGSAALELLYHESIIPGIQNTSQTSNTSEMRWGFVEEDIMPGGSLDIVSRIRLLKRAEDPEAYGEMSKPFDSFEDWARTMPTREWGPLTPIQADGFRNHHEKLYGPPEGQDPLGWTENFAAGPGSNLYRFAAAYFVLKLSVSHVDQTESLINKLFDRKPRTPSRDISGSPWRMHVQREYESLLVLDPEQQSGIAEMTNGAADAVSLREKLTEYALNANRIRRSAAAYRHLTDVTETAQRFVNAAISGAIAVQE